MRVIDIKNKNSINKAAETLKHSGILVFPTDTVYGIGCILNNDAIRKLYRIKNRPLNQPTAVLFSKKLYHSRCSSIQSGIGGVIKRYPKGKVTIVLDQKHFNLKFPKILLKDNKVGIRLPNYPWLERLIDKVGPVVASSANKKGEVAPKSFQEIDPKIIEESDLVIKTKDKLLGKPSTVYDIEENRVLR